MKGENVKRGNRWKGDNASYTAFHKWLAVHYGSPKHCDQCEGESKKSKCYNWALKKGKKHSHRRDNYLRLCRVCHIRYDWDSHWNEEKSRTFVKNVHSKEARKKRGNVIKGRKLSQEWKDKISVSLKRYYEMVREQEEKV